MQTRSILRRATSSRGAERQWIIVGANDTGIHLAETLGRRGQNIVLIDEREELLEGLNEEVDVLTMVGNPLAREVLQAAGIGNGVRLIVVTDSDELNILILFLGESLGILEGFALVRKRDVYESFLPRVYRTGGRLHLIPLWEWIASEIERKVHLQMRHLYAPIGGNSFLSAVHFLPQHPLIGHDVGQFKLGVRSRILTGFRSGRFIPVENGTKIDPGVVLLFEFERTEQERGTRRWVDFDSQHKIVVGGVDILQAFQLHWPNFSRDLVCIEKNLATCQQLLKMNSRALVLRGDGLDIALLKDEARIDEAQFFVAATEHDEVNLLSSLVAKSYHVKHVVTLLHHRQHSGMLERISLDGIIAIPQLVADYFLTLLLSNRLEAPLYHLDVRISTEIPTEGFSLLWKNYTFHLPKPHSPNDGEIITIVRI